MVSVKQEKLTVQVTDLQDANNENGNALYIFACVTIGEFVFSRISESLKTGKLSEVVDQIEWLLANWDESRPNLLGNIVYSLSHKSNLKLFIDILTSENVIDEISKKSYEHDNGFIKLVLLEGKSFKLRLHIWLPNLRIRKEDNDLHDHRWDFASVMVKGSFVTVLYQESDSGSEERYSYKYLPVAGGESYNLVRTEDNKVKLHESSRLLIKQGMGYFMPHETLHKVEYEGSESTITMVLTDKPVNENCRLYSQNERPEAEDVIVRRLDKRDIKNNLESLKYI